MKKKFFTILAVMLMSLTANAQHEYVDLGLPSGTLWATCNVGANSPEEEGDEFAWGETTTKNSYTQGNYSFDENPAVLDPENDAATVNWGSEWRMPSKAQCEELTCGKYTTNVYCEDGVRITGKNGNSIFLPEGEYWTINMYYDDLYEVWNESWAYLMTVRMIIGSDLDSDFDVSIEQRYWGHNIRPVRTQYTISNIPDGWRVNGTKVTNGTYEATPGAEVIFTPKNIPAGKKIKSIKAVKQ